MGTIKILNAILKLLLDFINCILIFRIMAMGLLSVFYLIETNQFDKFYNFMFGACLVYLIIRMFKLLFDCIFIVSDRRMEREELYHENIEEKEERRI